MMNDARLEAMLRAVTRAAENVEIYDGGEPSVTLATIRGVFTKQFTQFDSSENFGTQFEHTMETAMFVGRTIDFASVKNGHMVRYKGATPNVIYRVMDKRHDGHGMTALVLGK
jgi:hypothetical protein